MAKLSPWIKHVMETKRRMPKGTSLGAAMKKAKGTYKHHKKGGAFGIESETDVDKALGYNEFDGDNAEEGGEEGGEEKGGRRRSRRHRGGRTRRTRRHR